MRVICTKAEMSAPDGYSLFHFEYPQGERYPCKPDIFEATYEPVEPSREEQDDE